MSKLMTARFQSTCHVCGKTIAAGDAIYYDSNAPKGKKAWHEGCNSQKPQTTVAPTVAPEPISSPAEGKIAGLDYVESKSDFREFASVGDYCALKPSSVNELEFNRYREDAPTRNWFGGGAATWQDAVKIIEGGWDEGVRRLDEMAEGYIASRSATDIKRRLSFGDYGDECDIHRVYAGDLDRAWSRKSRKQRYAPPVIVLGAVIGGNCGRTPEQLFWRGAAVVKLADMLQAAGYNVEIQGVCAAYGAVSSGDRKSLYGHVFTIKESSMPLDLNSIASTVCYPGFMRYMMFKGIASCEKKMGRHYGTYGDDQYQQKIAEKTLAHFREGQIITVDVAIYDKASADAWIKKSIEHINNDTLHLQAA